MHQLVARVGALPRCAVVRGDCRRAARVVPKAGGNHLRTRSSATCGESAPFSPRRASTAPMTDWTSEPGSAKSVALVSEVLGAEPLIVAAHVASPMSSNEPSAFG